MKKPERSSAKWAKWAAEYAVGAADPKVYAEAMNRVEKADADWLAAANGETHGMNVVLAFCVQAEAKALAYVEKYLREEAELDVVISSLTNGLSYESVYDLAVTIWNGYDGGKMLYAMTVAVENKNLVTRVSNKISSTWSGNAWGRIESIGDYSWSGKHGNMGNHNGHSTESGRWSR